MKEKRVQNPFSLLYWQNLGKPRLHLSSVTILLCPGVRLPWAPRSDQLARELRSSSGPLTSAGFKLAWKQAIEEGQARQRSSLVPSE